jgi:hypothetical protein
MRAMKKRRLKVGDLIKRRVQRSFVDHNSAVNVPRESKHCDSHEFIYYATSTVKAIHLGL